MPDGLCLAHKAYHVQRTCHTDPSYCPVGSDYADTGRARVEHKCDRNDGFRYYAGLLRQSGYALRKVG